MKLVIPDQTIRLAYDALNDSYKLNEPGGENWDTGREGEKSTQDLKKFGSFQSLPLELPEPLDSAVFLGRRNPYNFSLAVRLAARDSNAAFSAKSGKFEDKLRQYNGQKYQFSPATRDLVGYITEGDKTSLVIVEEGQCRELSVGSRGACLRKFNEKFDDFRIEAKRLENLLGVVVSSIFDPDYEVIYRHKLPDLTLEFGLC